METQSLSCLPDATFLPFIAEDFLWPTKQFIHNKYLLYRWRNCSWVWLTLCKHAMALPLNESKWDMPEESQLGIGFCMNTMQQAWCELTESYRLSAVTQLLGWEPSLWKCRIQAYVRFKVFPSHWKTSQLNEYRTHNLRGCCLAFSVLGGHAQAIQSTTHLGFCKLSN